MLTMNQMLKIDPSLADLNEADFEHLRITLYDMAQLAFEAYWVNKNGSNNPLRSLQNNAISAIVKPWKRPE